MKDYVLYSCIYLPYSFLRKKLITGQNAEIQNKESIYRELISWGYKIPKAHIPAVCHSN